MDVGPALRAARLRAGLTQSELATLAGTSQATISAYESQSKHPSVATLARLLAATGSRLTVETASRPFLRPTPSQSARAGRTLLEVIALAEALPVRHSSTLRFPRLNAGTDQPT
jgi:transcriptional regulator with XRE-family HTH domain